MNGWKCPRCGARVGDGATECDSCGLPTLFTDAEESRVVEPEVLSSLDEAERTRHVPAAGRAGCTLGPGCGCLGLPLAAVVGLVVSSLLALLWVLSLGRVPASLLRLARLARRGPPQG